MQLDLCWGNPATGPALIRNMDQAFWCRAAGDCEEQAELKIKSHWTSWMRPSLHRRAGYGRALPMLWGDGAQGFPE